MSKNNVIEAKGISKEYSQGGKKFYALKDINFDLKEGQDLVIMGTSGSGKSTLLNLISGLDRPDKGSVHIDGKDINKMSDEEISRFRNATIGFVFQAYNLIEYLSATENVAYPMIISGANKNKAFEKARVLLSKLGLKDKLNAYPNQMSGGEMQRVSIARSLINDPKIILADEPTGNLDKESTDQVLDTFREINKNNVSIVIVTHDPRVTTKFTNVINLDHGEILN